MDVKQVTNTVFRPNDDTQKDIEIVKLREEIAKLKKEQGSTVPPFPKL